jgi:hypothetical protein
VIVSLAGIFLIRDRSARSLAAGGFAGYVLYGIVFSYQTSTHDYYHLPLIPLVGLGLGAAFSLAVEHFQAPRWLRSALLCGLLLTFALSNLWGARTELKRADHRADAALAEEIGAMFRPEDRVVSIAPYYSYALKYWGWVNATNWLSAGDFEVRALAGQEVDVQAAFREAIAGKDFFLVMDFTELDRQPLVRQQLDENYPLIKQTEGYAVYDLRAPLGVDK